MTRLFFSSATLKATHWPYRMIAMNRRIDSAKLIAKDAAKSSPSWGPATASGSAASSANVGRREQERPGRSAGCRPG